MPPAPYSMLASLVAAVVALDVTPGAALELRDADDAAELCGFCRCAIERFELGDNDNSGPGEGSREALEGPSVDQVAADPPSDPVVLSFAAREYARRRAHLLVQPHEVVVESTVFPIVEFDDEVGALTISLTGEIELFGGLYAMVVADDRWLEFPMAPDEADMVLAQHEMGALAVRLIFVVGTTIDRAFCEEGDDGVIRIEITPMAADLVEPLTQTRRARAVTAAYAVEQARTGVDPAELRFARRPVVQVTALEVEGQSGCSSTDATLLQMHLETMLTDCYVAGLRDNGRLTGVLVLSFELAPDGSVQDAEVQIDVLEDAGTRACVLETLTRLAIRRDEHAEAASVRSTIAFRQD